MPMSLGLLGLGLTRQQVAAGFSPLSLFAGSEDGAWYEPSPDSCFQDAAATTPAGVGDPVGYLADLSGNGNHATQATLGQRPTLRQTAGGLYYLEIDLADDKIGPAIDLASARWSFGVAYQPSGENFVLIHNDSGTPWAIAAETGSSNTTILSGGTLNGLYYDNALSSATTRGQLYTEAQSASRVLLDFTPAAVTWGSADYGDFGVFPGLGDLYGSILINRELTSAERSSLDGYFQERLP